MPNYSVEFFHIYVDEKISPQHVASIEYLKTLYRAWPHNLEPIVLIDNYNPKRKFTSDEEIINFLLAQGIQLKFWAYEADLVISAKKFLSMITNNKLQNEYLRYIQKHNKYPCSLLTASWYLIRLGRFKPTGIIRSSPNQGLSSFMPAERLINILPRAYKPMEERSFNLISHSKFSQDTDVIQDLFYDSENGKVRDLF